MVIALAAVLAEVTDRLAGTETLPTAPPKLTKPVPVDIVKGLEFSVWASTVDVKLTSPAVVARVAPAVATFVTPVYVCAPVVVTEVNRIAVVGLLAVAESDFNEVRPPTIPLNRIVPIAVPVEDTAND